MEYTRRVSVYSPSSVLAFRQIVETGGRRNSKAAELIDRLIDRQIDKPEHIPYRFTRSTP